MILKKQTLLERPAPAKTIQHSIRLDKRDGKQKRPQLNLLGVAGGILLIIVLGCGLSRLRRTDWRHACVAPDGSLIGAVTDRTNDFTGVLINLETGATERRINLDNGGAWVDKTALCLPDNEIAVISDGNATWLTKDYSQNVGTNVFGAISSYALAAVVAGRRKEFKSNQPGYAWRAALVKIGDEPSDNDFIVLSKDLFVEKANSIIGENGADEWFPLAAVYPVTNGKLMFAASLSPPTSDSGATSRWGVFAVDLPARRIAQFGASKIFSEDTTGDILTILKGRMTVSRDERVIAGIDGSDDGDQVLFAFKIDEEAPFFTRNIPTTGSTALALSADGKLLSATIQPRGFSSGRIEIYDLGAGEKLWEMPIKKTALIAQFLADDVFVLATADATVKKLAGRSGKVLSENDFGAAGEEK